jgi:hypothetical protein
MPSPRFCLVTTLFCAALLGAPLRARADGFRCGQRLVNTGDVKEQVLLKCGEPMTQERWMEEEIQDDDEGRRPRKGVKVPMERWVYNLGSTQFLRILLFRRGVLVQIQTGDRGS